MFLLTLLRHAHADRAHVDGSDSGRPLNLRGRGAARVAAALIARVQPPPDRVIASPAARTRETAEALRAAACPGVTVEYRPELYLAPVDVLRDAMAGAWAPGRHLAIVGHNPGLSELAGELAGENTFAGLEPAEGWTFRFDGDRPGSPVQSVVRHRDGMR